MKKYGLLSILVCYFMSCSIDKSIPITDYDVKHCRGINITCADETELQKSDIEQWKLWNINTVRINFNKDDILNCYTNEPKLNVWIPYLKNKQKIERWINWLKEYNIQVIVSLDMLWGDDHNSNNLWDNYGANVYLDHRIKLCSEMEKWATKFENIVYIEAWNEPHPYNNLYKTNFLPRIVSEFKSQKYQIKLICMAPADWGSITGFNNWEGLKTEGIIYSTHIYSPWLYTHQKIYGNPVVTEGWPGWHKFYSTEEQAVYLDINSIRDYVKSIISFRKATESEVIITEFGVARWAKDNDKYLKDLITVFEENKIPWIFHSMAGWNGWNPSYNASSPIDNLPLGGHETEALKVLKNYWSLNL